MASVLVLHGLGGCDGSVAPLAGALRAGGHVVSSPTLPGHGTVPEDLGHVGWTEWRRAAADALHELTPPVVVVGQSMGATIGLDLAAQGVDALAVAAVACINPIVQSDEDVLEHLEHQIRRGVTTTEPTPADIRDPHAVDPGYDRVPLRALIEMVSHVGAVPLGEITRPVLVVTSLDDNVVDPSNSDIVAASVSGPVDRLLLRRSGHVATLDRERDLLAAALLDWIDGLSRAR